MGGRRRKAKIKEIPCDRHDCGVQIMEDNASDKTIGLYWHKVHEHDRQLIDKIQEFHCYKIFSENNNNRKIDGEKKVNITFKIKDVKDWLRLIAEKKVQEKKVQEKDKVEEKVQETLQKFWDNGYLQPVGETKYTKDLPADNSDIDLNWYPSKEECGEICGRMLNQEEGGLFYCQNKNENFYARDAVTWLVQFADVACREAAVLLGEKMRNDGLFEHAENKKSAFMDLKERF